MLLLTTRGGSRYRKLPEGTITPLRQAQQIDALARGTSASQLGVHATAAIWHGLADDSQLGRLARFARGLFLLPLRASSRRFHADDCAMGN